jgi:ribosome maturation factor RimP
MPLFSGLKCEPKDLNGPCAHFLFRGPVGPFLCPKFLCARVMLFCLGKTSPSNPPFCLGKTSPSNPPFCHRIAKWQVARIANTLSHTDRPTQLEAALRPIVEALGYEFWCLELVQSRGHSLLRIYIELDDRHITVSDCARVSRALSDKLDEIDLISEDYSLEVSSPGLDRPLVTPSHFVRAIGEELRVETHLPIDGRKRYRAHLVAVEGAQISLSFEKKTVSLALAQIAKAQVIPDYSKARVARRNDPKPGDSEDPVEGADVLAPEDGSDVDAAANA